ncbi:MAG: peptidase T, partial [Bacteroidetes bacterium]
FVRYAKIDTRSDEDSATTPSTAKQLNLANLLVEELQAMGLTDSAVDENGYVMATLPSNIDREVPVVGFVSHMDTAPDASDENVNPQFIENYDGSNISLGSNAVLSPSDFPELLEYVGQTLITTDGATLLGADDKAGIAEIMTAMEYLVTHPEIKHGTVKIGFTPDEEIGRGADKFDVKRFGADFAYTLDGGRIGELEYENFNAAGLTVTVFGRNVHPGTAKNQMINAITLGMEYDRTLPHDQRPEHTEGYEGFFHLMDFQGAVDSATLRYIIRDHDKTKFEQKKTLAKHTADFLNKKYGKEVIVVELKDQYFNMKEKIEPVKYIVDIAEQAMVDAGVEPIKNPIRGGTDGSKLSFMGLPTPNIFAGGHNFHGIHEYVPIPSMEKAVEVIVNLIKNVTTLEK